MKPHGGSWTRNTNGEASCFADGTEASPVQPETWCVHPGRHSPHPAPTPVSCELGSPCFPGPSPPIAVVSFQSLLLLTPKATTSSWIPRISAHVSWPVTHTGSSQPCPSPAARRALPQSGTQGLSLDISSSVSCSVPGSWSSELPEPLRPYCSLPSAFCPGGKQGFLSRTSFSSVLSPPQSTLTSPATCDPVTLCVVICMCVLEGGHGS